MKLRTNIMLILLLFNSLLKAQENQKIPADYKGLTFKEFVSAAESIQKIKFFYKEDWVKDLTLGDYPGCKTLTDVLDNLFRGTSVYYYIDNFGNVVLTKFYNVRIAAKPAEDETNYLPPSDYGDIEENAGMKGNTFVEIGNPAEKNIPGNVIVSGYITNSETKDAVAGVTIFVQKLSAGTISNAFGYYTLSLPRGIHQIQFSFIGMREKIINLNLNGAGEMNVEMNSMLIPLKETVVSARKNMTLQRFEVGAEKINITSFKLLPTAMGESDIIKSVLLIPGVQSVGEGSAGFNVRGGSADQNLILLNNAPVYNASHFFGFFSSVNSDIIKDVTLYKGGIPGSYGGRISSVLDIGTLDGNKNEFGGNAGISPITAHAMVEGPLIKDTLSYMLTARTTYSNWVLKVIDNSTLNNSSASFYDVNGKITYDINKNNKIELSSYFSHDSFSFSSDSLYKYDNNIFALKWRHFFTSRFFSSISLNNSFYKYEISTNQLKPDAFELSHKINSTGLKADFNWFKGKNEVNFGADMIRYAVLPGQYLPSNDSSIVVPHSIDTENAWERSLYIDDKFPVTSYLSVNIGMRFSGYTALGPGAVMVYEPGYPKSRSSITDTLNFSTGESSVRYGGPELRASLNFRISGNSSFKINYNRTRQYIHQLSNSTSISPTDTWKLSDYHLNPQVGDQIGLGFYQMLFNNGFETYAEVYYKKIRDMADFKGGTDLVMNERIAEDLVNVDGKAYGLELVFKKMEGRLQYTLGYTYARTFVRSTSSISDEVINEGEWFPASFDKPNDLSVSFNYLLSRRFSLSCNYVYSTGRPITYPIATYFMFDNILVHYSDRNKYRIPDYSRFDISFKVSGSLKIHKLAHPNWIFSVYNLFGRENVYSIYFKKEGDVYKGYKLSVFGQAIPTITFNFDF